MTLKMVRTRLKGFGFPPKYAKLIVNSLNRTYDERRGHRSMNHLELEAIGRTVSPDVQCTREPITEDKYRWFEGLEYVIKGVRIAILFPHKQKSDNPESKLDRSIGIYKRGGWISPDIVVDLLEKLASQMSLENRRRTV